MYNFSQPRFYQRGDNYFTFIYECQFYEFMLRNVFMYVFAFFINVYILITRQSLWSTARLMTWQPKSGAFLYATWGLL